MAILAGSGANADVAEESVMHPIIEAGIMKTRTRPRRTAGRTRLVWHGPPDRAAGRCPPRLLPGLRPWPRLSIIFTNQGPPPPARPTGAADHHMRAGPGPASPPPRPPPPAPSIRAGNPLRVNGPRSAWYWLALPGRLG